MANREWFSEGVQQYEDSSFQRFAEGAQFDGSLPPSQLVPPGAFSAVPGAVQCVPSRAELATRFSAPPATPAGRALRAAWVLGTRGVVIGVGVYRNPPSSMIEWGRRVRRII